MKLPLSPILIVLVSIFLLAQTTAASENSLSTYLTEALSYNEDIKAAQSKMEAAQHKTRRSGVLPDPKLGVSYYLESVETRTGPQEASVSLSQGVPWPGKRPLVKKISEQDTHIAKARLDAVQLAVTSQVKQIYVEYGFNQESQRIKNENLELLKYLEGVALTKYAGGKLDYDTILKIQIEIAKAEDRLHTEQNRTLSIQARLNSLLGADTHAHRPVPQVPSISIKETVETLSDHVQAKSPRLHEAREKITKAKFALELAKKDFYPDLNFSLKTIVTGNAEFGDPPDSGRDPVIAGVTVNLPVFRDRRHGAVEENKATLKAAQTSYNQLLRTLKADIEQSLFRYQNAERSFTLYKDTLLPKIKQELEVAMEAFQSGRLSIQSLIDAEQDLLQFQLAGSRAQSDKAIEVARLEKIVGTTLVDWQ